MLKWKTLCFWKLVRKQHVIFACSSHLVFEDGRRNSHRLLFNTHNKWPTQRNKRRDWSFLCECEETKLVKTANNESQISIHINWLNYFFVTRCCDDECELTFLSRWIGSFCWLSVITEYWEWTRFIVGCSSN